MGASELAIVSADKSKLQDVADAVAMDASQELAFSVDQTVVDGADRRDHIMADPAAEQRGKIGTDMVQGITLGITELARNCVDIGKKYNR